MQQDRKGYSFTELLIVAAIVVTFIREIVIPIFSLAGIMNHPG